MQYTEITVSDQRILDALSRGFVDYPVDGMVTNAPVVVKGSGSNSILARYYKGKLVRLITPTIYDFAPKNKEQAYLWDSALNPDNIATIAVGGAATGKTFPAVLAGLHYVLETKEYEGITLVKPNIPLGRTSGFLPGTLEEKMDPILQSFYDHIRKIIKSKRIIEDLKTTGKLECLPIEYARGRTLEKRVVIFDEMQNCDYDEAMALLSRCTDSCKVFVLGDDMQVDKASLRAANDGLTIAYNSLVGEEWVGAIKMDNEKNLRGKLSAAVIKNFPLNKPKN